VRPRIHLSPPHLAGTELDYLRSAIESNWIAPLGPHVDAFETELALTVGVSHALAVSSGTAALHLAMLVLDVGPGDEVLCATLTFAACANAIRYVGAVPVFVDCDADTWTIDIALVEDELRRRAARRRLPKAVLAVDLYGQCADYRALAPLCARYGVPLVEDAAEALGATCAGRAAGSWGTLAVISFNGNKIITASAGGMLLSDDGRLIDRARHLATQARDPAPHYQHTAVGHNYRLSNLLAAVGRAQLRALGERVAARRANFDFYRRALDALPGLAFMPEAPYGRCSRWLTCITVDPHDLGCAREDLRLALEAENIESRPVWKPLHLQPAFAGAPAAGGSVAERLFQHGLCLPSGSALAEDDRARVARVIAREAARAGDGRDRAAAVGGTATC
jgi:pyridoxal phosphate-dependent aminotransferase EpsN